MLSDDPARAGERIRHAINTAGLTQAQVAAAIGVTPQSVNRWIKDGKISRENLMALSRATGSTFTWLATGEGLQLYRTAESIYQTFADSGLIHAQVMDDLGIAPCTFVQWIVEASPEDLPQMTDRIVDVLHTSKEFTVQIMKMSLMEGTPEIQADFRGGGAAWHTPVSGALEIGADGWGRLVDTETKGIDARTGDPTEYGVLIKGTEMEPAICHNWIALIEPGREPSPGEYVLVLLTDGRCRIQELLYRRADEYHFSAILDQRRMSVDASEVEYIRRIGALVQPPQ